MRQTPDDKATIDDISPLLAVNMGPSKRHGCVLIGIDSSTAVIYCRELRDTLERRRTVLRQSLKVLE